MLLKSLRKPVDSWQHETDILDEIPRVKLFNSFFLMKSPLNITFIISVSIPCVRCKDSLNSCITCERCNLFSIQKEPGVGPKLKKKQSSVVETLRVAFQFYNRRYSLLILVSELRFLKRIEIWASVGIKLICWIECSMLPNRCRST